MRGKNERNCCDEAKFNFRLVVDDAHGFGTRLELVRNKEFKMILMFIFQLCKING
jgi:hypothetical protein